MRKQTLFTVALALALLSALGVIAIQAEGRELLAPPPAFSDAFTYQGRILEDGQPASGNYDFLVSIWDSPTGGASIADAYIYNLDDKPVSNGIFSLEVMPQAAMRTVFDGSERWLEVQVRPHGTGSFSTFARQEILATPYAWGLKAGAKIWDSSSGHHLLEIKDKDNNTSYDALVVYGQTTLQSNDASPALLAINASSEAARFLGDVNIQSGGNLEVAGDVEYGGALKGAFPRPAYDSGWVSIAQGEAKTLTHNLGGNADDYVVDLTFKSDAPTYGINQLFFGGMYAYDPLKYYGAYWRELTSAKMVVSRQGDDIHVDKIRVRIWVIK